MTFANKTNLGEEDEMKKLIQVLIVSGLILVMGGTAQGHGTIQQSKFKRNHEKDIMLYAHITDFEHKHDNGDLHKADKNYKFKKSAVAVENDDEIMLISD